MKQQQQQQQQRILRDDAIFLQQQQQVSSTSMMLSTANGSGTASNNTGSNSATNSDDDNIAQLQVHNRLHLQVQDLLFSSSSSSSSSSISFFPWRSKKGKSSITAGTNSTANSSSNRNMLQYGQEQEKEDIIQMKQWWKKIQLQIQESQIVPILEKIPSSKVLHNNDTEEVDHESDTATALKVVPFASTEYPPLGVSSVTYNCSTSASTRTSSTVATSTVAAVAVAVGAHKCVVVQIPMTVVLPISKVIATVNDYKNEIYFVKRQCMIQNIASYIQQQSQLQSQLQQNSKTTMMKHRNNNTKNEKKQFTVIKAVSIQKIDIRKSFLIIIIDPSNNSSTSSSMKNTKSEKRKMLLQFNIHFQMDTIDWLIPKKIIRLLPNRCNNNNTNTNNINGTNDSKDDSNYSVQYNYSITEDMLYVLQHQHQQHDADDEDEDDMINSNDTDRNPILLQYMNIRYAIYLIIFWLQQRGLYHHCHRFSSSSIDTISFNKEASINAIMASSSNTFDDNIIEQIVRYMIYSKRISMKLPPFTIFTAFLTLLSENNWILPQSHTTTTITSQQSSSNNHKGKKHGHRSVFIQPQYIGQSSASIIENSLLAQRYASMIHDEYAAAMSSSKHNPQSNIHHPAVSKTSTTTSLLYFLECTDCITTPCLYDTTLLHNYMFRISSYTMILVQQYAKKSLSCIHPSMSNITLSHTNPYQHLFASSSLSPSINAQGDRSIFYSLYDVYIQLPIKYIDRNKNRHWKTNSVSNNNSHKNNPNHWMYDWTKHVIDIGYDVSILRNIIQLLRHALNDRIVAINGIIDSNKNGNPSDSGPKSKKQKQGTILDNNSGRRDNDNSCIVIGISINSDTCYRVVDRCLTDDTTAEMDHDKNTNDTVATNPLVQEFLTLWGKKAELRRFKDGAIAYAVVWDHATTTSTAPTTSARELSQDDHIRYHNDDTWQGGIVECIVRYILKLHYIADDIIAPHFFFRDMISLIDGFYSGISVSSPSSSTTQSPMTSPMLTNPMFAHRSVMKSFELLSEWLRKNSTPSIPIPGSTTALKSALGIPLTIDRVEALSPALRYVALYPPIPHPLLTSSNPSSSALLGLKKCSSAVQSDPIRVQLCFGPSSKWPTDLKAICAAKTAMLIEIVKGIERIKKSESCDATCKYFDEKSTIITPTYADLCFMGYVFRVTIKATHEIKILLNLNNPSKDAERLLQSYTKQSIIAAKHHSLIHAVYTSHPSSSATVRLVKRWLSSHLLSSDSDDGYCVPFEVIELTVAHVYTNQSNRLSSPGTVTSGFMCWLYFISTHNWLNLPLVVDPQCHLNDTDHCSILDQFECDRTETFERGPAWYIVASYDRSSPDGIESNDSSENIEELNNMDKQTKRNSRKWSPSSSLFYPERVVASRIVALAQRTYSYLQQSMKNYHNNCDDASGMVNDSAWAAAFQESRNSFLSYSVLLRIDPSFLVNMDASSSVPINTLLPQKLASQSVNGNDIEYYESTYTRSMYSLSVGPKDLRRKLYRNLMIETNDSSLSNNVLTEWRPIRTMIQMLRSRLGQLMILFYNDLCPEVVGIVWRHPNFYQSRPFSALTSEYARPIITNDNKWISDTLVSYNAHDILRTISLYTRSIVTDVKVFDYGSTRNTIDTNSDGTTSISPILEEEKSGLKVQLHQKQTAEISSTKKHRRSKSHDVVQSDLYVDEDSEDE